jgi:ABC-type nitrate/sulfonate/bicarbonate transport system permease component
LVLLAIWTYAAWGEKTFVLPTPYKVAVSFVSMLGEPKIYEHVLASVLRVLVGMLLGGTLGVAVGIAAGVSRFVDSQVTYIVRFIAPIPGIAWIGITLVWFGLTEAAIIAVIFVTVFPPIVLYTMQGVRSVDSALIEAAQTLGADRYRMVTRVILPAALPLIAEGLTLGFAFAWRVLAAGEMVGAVSGLGYYLNFSRELLDTPRVLSIILLFGIIMLFLEEVVVKALKRRLLGRWRA